MSFGTLKLAGLFAFISAAIHIVLAVLGLAPDLMQFLIAGALWLLVGLGLWRGIRWIAYIGFLYGLIGVIAALSGLGLSSQTDMGLWGIVTTDAMVTLTLFIHIWRRA